MDLSKIKPINLYQLSLLNVEYIDFDNSVINSDGTVNIMLNTQKIPKPNFSVNIDDWVFENLLDSDECYIKFNPEQGIAESLYVEYYAVLHKYDFVYTTTLFFMRELNHSEYIKYANMYDEFNSTLNEEQQKMFKNYVEHRNEMDSIINEQLFMFGYLTASKLREETIEQFKSKWKNEQIKGAIEYFKGKTLEEGDNITMTVDFLENLEVLLNYIEVI